MQYLTGKSLSSAILKSFSLLLLLVLFQKPVLSQTNDYDLISKVPVKANFLTTDFLKSAYVITSKNQVMKYDSTGTLIGVYSDNKYGPLSSIDATSPFNVLLFYKEFSTIVMADMRLSAKRLYKLPSVGMNNIAAACLSNDNYIWIYDMDEAKLKKINQNYEVIYESLDLTQILGEAIDPSYLIERDGFVYMNIPNMGIIMFDLYGNFYSSVSNTDIGEDNTGNFQVIGGKIVYYSDGKLFVYNPGSRSQEVIPVPKSVSTSEVKVEKGNLYMLDNKELQFYSLIR